MKNSIASVILVFLLLACHQKESPPQDSDIYYTCSMDPQVVELKPGKCPICKMDLTPVKKGQAGADGELQLSDQQIRLGNISADSFRRSGLTQRIILPATLNFDQRKTYAVSSRIMGRVEKLYYKSSGDFVLKGSALYDLFSEELNNAKLEYILSLEQKEKLANPAGIDMDQLVAAAENKLLLWGLLPTQVKELANSRTATPTSTFYSPVSGYITSLAVLEGEYIMEGGPLIYLADLTGLWAEAQVFSSQLADLKDYETAVIRIPDLGNKEISGRVELINPELASGTRISYLRVSIPNAAAPLRPGMAAYVVLENTRPGIFTLPIDAVIRDEKTSSVWIQTSANAFKNVMVETGAESDDRIEIKSGLTEGQLVVQSGAYLLQSEYIFRKGADPMATHQH